MKTCKHPTCEGPCRRPKKEKKRYFLNRSLIKKKPYRIKQVSNKRTKENQQYSNLRKTFLIENPECQINSPECTCIATEVHHTRGRENKLLLFIKYWKASCHNCNQYVERFSKWAYDTGNKLYKHKKIDEETPNDNN